MEFLPEIGEIAVTRRLGMSRRPRQNHSPAIKAKVALEAIGGETSLSELAQSEGKGDGDVDAEPQESGISDMGGLTEQLTGHRFGYGAAI